MMEVVDVMAETEVEAEAKAEVPAAAMIRGIFGTVSNCVDLWSQQGSCEDIGVR